MINTISYNYKMHNKIHRVKKICEHFKDLVLQLLLNIFTVDIDIKTVLTTKILNSQNKIIIF